MNVCGTMLVGIVADQHFRLNRVRQIRSRLKARKDG